VGNRVLGALIASGLCRISFTTNFDSVVEKAVAEVSGQSIAAYHLEGSHAAKQALIMRSTDLLQAARGFPIRQLKNLSDDLARQNTALCRMPDERRCPVWLHRHRLQRRDESVMALFRSALDQGNPFPHGLYWTGIKRISGFRRSWRRCWNWPKAKAWIQPMSD